MKDIKGFITELEALKMEMGKGQSSLTASEKRFILERKVKELQTKNEQIGEEIQREVEDFFAYLNMKQASIEILEDMKRYVTEELSRLDQEIKRLKLTESA